jgi:hypothetical protein
MTRTSKRRPYEQFKQLASVAVRNHNHLNSINDVVEAIGYSRYAENAWQKADNVPETAIWAIKGYDQETKKKGISFSKEELFDIISSLPEEKLNLIQKAVRILRNLS